MFGDELRAELNRVAECIGIDAIRKCQESATNDAIRVAVENTPPNKAVGQRSGLATGEMANRWQKDSISKPDEMMSTYLINTEEYASYVNDGHYLPKHFVPHLFIKDGKLQYDSSADGGITVGTKTSYVKGYYMKEKAKKEFQKRFKIGIDKLWERTNRG